MSTSEPGQAMHEMVKGVVTESTAGDPEDSSRLFSAYRLQVARQARGLTKSELSTRVGVSTPAISQFERSQARPTAATVVRLARALEFPVRFFSSAAVFSDAPHADDEGSDSFGHFRSLRSLTATRRRKVLTVAHLLRDVVSLLEGLVRLPEPSVSEYTGGSAADIALRVRADMGVEPGPIPDVLRLLERHGVVCARFPIDAPDVTAFSVPTRRRTFLVLKRRGDAQRDRDRFSACHELGHVVLHEPGRVLASKEIERQADEFSAEFLMPSDQIRDELPSTLDWPALLQLKQRWGVSLAALLRRARDLTVMSDALHLQAMRTMSARGWRIDEPGSVGAVETPTLLIKAIGLANMSASEVGAATGWPVEMVSELLTATAEDRPSVEF